MARSGISWGLSDPNDKLATAIAGLGDAFGPPKATDIYAYAKAASERADMERKADAFKRLDASPTLGGDASALIAATGTAANLDQIARRNLYLRSQQPGVALGDLDAGVYAINGNFGNTQAGNTQDQDAKLRQALGVQELTNRGNLDVERAKPITLSEGQTYTLGPDEAARRGVPQSGMGVIKATEGSGVRLPDGSTYLGPEKADKNPAAGVKNYRTADGKQGTAKLDPIKGWVDTQDGSSVPQGAITFEGLPAAGTTVTNKSGNFKLPDGSIRLGVTGPDGIPRDQSTGQPFPAGTGEMAQIPGKDKGVPEIREEKNAAGQADRFIEIQKKLDDEAGSARRKLDVANQLSVLAQRFPQGFGEAAKGDLARMLQGLGIQPPAGATAQQMYDVLSGQLVIENASSLGQNPSNADRDFIARGKPNPSNTAATNEFITRQMQGQAKQALALASMAREYAIKNGGMLDDKFLAMADEYRARNPVFLREILNDPTLRQQYEADLAAVVERNKRLGIGGQPAGAPVASAPAAPGAAQDGQNPASAAPRQAQGDATPAGARRAPDGLLYVPDPNRPGKYLRVD